MIIVIINDQMALLEKKKTALRYSREDGSAATIFRLELRENSP